MKKRNILFVLATVVASGCLPGNSNTGSDQNTGPHTQPAINVVYYQDVTLSTKENGVELINASVFSPYYCNIGRNIQLNFGLVSKQSASKLITVELPAI